MADELADYFRQDQEKGITAPDLSGVAMNELYSCRNCIHNCGQSLLIGKETGYCIKHDSVLFEPVRTTCKYLHRKDLPRFVVDEGLREHAGEFARFSALADLLEHKPVERLPYNEKFAWERHQFDPLNQSLAQYHKTKPVWIFLQAMSGGLDGRRSLAHASLVRRYMDQCGTWRSSYRFILALLQELPSTPQFQDNDLNTADSQLDDEMRQEAVWDVFFTRLSGLQEYGFHAGLEDLMWATDHLNGALATLDWSALKAELDDKAPEWAEQVIQHAKSENAFFPSHPPSEELAEELAEVEAL
ncbi:MAG: hypothetical protein HOP19_00465 [Acidobacteria bacterium]|nr:hypothetical protein [Acidobacteriota bacterium]